MPDLQQILQGVASGLLTGGASAGTTFLTVFKNIKSRITDLEAKVGDNQTDPKTGIYYSLDTLTKNIRNLKHEIESWREDPPDWLLRIVQRATRPTFTNEAYREFEDRIEQRLKTFKTSLDRLEDDLDRREEKLQDEIHKSSPEHATFIMRMEYEEDSQRRAEEMMKIKENLSSANSFLRGVMAVLGQVDPEPPTRPRTPMSPPRIALNPPRPSPVKPPPLKK
jgi:chromosome segregation ATPase